MMTALGLLAALGALGAGAWMHAEARRVTVEREELALERLPRSFDGLRLFFISDIHRRVVPSRLVEACRQAGGADLVLVGGDLREKRVPLSRTRDNIRTLFRIAPVYAVYGNHDYDDDARELEVMLREEGVRMLVNEHVVLEQPDGSAVRLAGVDDPRTRRDRLHEALAASAAGTADNRAEPFTLLVAHDPSIATRLDGGRIDLILSGHTHGGQIVLPLLGPLLRSASVVQFRRGWFSLPACRADGIRPLLFVSCGFGTSKMPLRLLAPAQTHLFVLRSAASVAPVSIPDGSMKP